MGLLLVRAFWLGCFRSSIFCLFLDCIEMTGVGR